MPSIDLGRITPIPKGTWVSSTTYERLDIVLHDASSYIAKQDVPVNTSITTSEYWQLLVGNTISTSTVPQTGYHTQGEMVYNSQPVSAGYIGWVCVETGTPGTWKTFGLIS